MGRDCSYLLPKQDGGTCQILVNPTEELEHQSHPVLLFEVEFTYQLRKQRSTLSPFKALIKSSQSSCNISCALLITELAREAEAARAACYLPPSLDMMSWKECVGGGPIFLLEHHFI